MYPVSLDSGTPSTYPVSLSVVKKQLGIDHDELNETLLDLHIPAAVQWAEGELHRAIVSRECTWVLSDFPRGMDMSIRLPLGKTQSVASIVYTQNNAQTTLTGPSSGSPGGTGYREDLRGNEGGILYPAYNTEWPDVDCDAPAPVVISFTAGWTAAQIPADIKAGIIRHIADAIDVRSIQDLPQSFSAWHLDAKMAAISGWRLSRWW